MHTHILLQEDVDLTIKNSNKRSNVPKKAGE